MPQITITFPDGSSRKYDEGVPALDVAKSISQGLAREALAAEVNGEVRDLARPLSADAAVKFLKWNDAGGKYAYWHSSAHLMAEAIEAIFPGTKFGIGPPIEQGFYYDIDMGDHSLTMEDLARIEGKMGELAARDVPYRREEKSWDEAVAWFTKKGDPYKLELLDGLKGQTITFYHQGNFTDLCYGPHIPSTGRIKAIIGDTKKTKLYGLSQWAGTAYAFSGTGEIVEIDMATGAAKLVTGLVYAADAGSGALWFGAGVTTDAPTKP